MGGDEGWVVGGPVHLGGAAGARGRGLVSFSVSVFGRGGDY